MTFQGGNFYHVFNRGNNKQKIFYRDENYKFFVKKMSVELKDHCNLVAYCLMPNHFHLLIHVNEVHTQYLVTERMQKLERKIGTLQSSYTRAINNQEKRVGSLFQPKAKVVELSDYQMAFYCFQYIHQNPVKAGLTKSMSDWTASSYVEYANLLEGICHKSISYEMLGVASASDAFEQQSIGAVNNPEVQLALEGF